MCFVPGAPGGSLNPIKNVKNLVKNPAKQLNPFRNGSIRKVDSSNPLKTVTQATSPKSILGG